MAFGLLLFDFIEGVVNGAFAGSVDVERDGNQRSSLSRDKKRTIHVRVFIP